MTRLRCALIEASLRPLTRLGSCSAPSGVPQPRGQPPLAQLDTLNLASTPSSITAATSPAWRPPAPDTLPQDRAQGTHSSATAMSQTKAPKVRVTLFCILVGVVLALVAVVTDHWAVLSPELDHHNATCEAAHFGLWRICTKRIVMTDSKDKTCGPITLPGGNVPAP